MVSWYLGYVGTCSHRPRALAVAAPDRACMTVDPAQIRWPNGYRQTYFNKIWKHRDAILSGRVLGIDPATGATSNPGWALMVAGEIIDSGEIAGLKGSTPERLRQLFERLSGPEFAHLQPVDVLLVEMLRGSMVHVALHWSVGVIVTALPAEIICETPIQVWKCVSRADSTYTKTDANDARCFCTTALLVASGLGPAAGAPAPAGRQRRKRGSTKRSSRVRNAARRKRNRTGGRKCRTSR